MYTVTLFETLDSPLDIPTPILVQNKPDYAIPVTVHYQTFLETTTVETTNCQTNAFLDGFNSRLYISDKDTAWDVAEYLRGGTRLRIDRGDN